MLVNVRLRQKAQEVFFSPLTFTLELIFFCRLHMRVKIYYDKNANNMFKILSRPSKNNIKPSHTSRNMFTGY